MLIEPQAEAVKYVCHEKKSNEKLFRDVGKGFF